MQKHKHYNGYLIEMEHQCSERKSSPSVVARLMGLEEMLDNSTITSQGIGVSYLSQYEENDGFKISLEVGN